METIIIPLKGSVGVADVVELHSASLEAIVANNVVAFDFSEATDIDASILQLLLATHAASLEHKTNTVLTGVTDRLRKSLEGYGKPELLDLIGEIDVSAATATQKATPVTEESDVAVADETTAPEDATAEAATAEAASEEARAAAADVTAGSDADVAADKSEDADSSAKKSE